MENNKIGQAGWLGLVNPAKLELTPPPPPHTLPHTYQGNIEPEGLNFRGITPGNAQGPWVPELNVIVSYILI